jgi:hypothetical protein
MKWSILLFCLLIGGCQERIFLDNQPGDFQFIAINGLIDNSEGPYFVSVQETRNAIRAPLPVEEAFVMLVDGEGNREVCPHLNDGRYVCPAEVVQSRPGRVYHIEVRLGEDLYRSQPEILPQILGTNQLVWEENTLTSTTPNGLDVVTDIVEFDLVAQLPETTTPTFLQWQLLETFQIRPTDFPDPFGFTPPPCFITQNIGVQNFYTLALDNYEGSNFRIESVIQREIDKSFIVKHIFSIHQSSVSETYLRYLDQTNVLTEATGSLFDAPAGRVIGNILHEGDGPEAVGYFAAVTKDTTHMVIYREELNTWVEDVCVYNQFKPIDQYPRTCLDCLIIPRSTNDEPYWWSRVE